MKERVKNAITEYNERFLNSNQGQFNLYDVFSVCQESNKYDYADVAANALKAGFIIGYRKGKKDANGRIRERRC